MKKIWTQCPLVKGENLTESQRGQVKRWFPQANDQWIKEHAFYITRKGDLSARHNYCEPAYMADETYSGA
jgi:hypothetical protein